MVTCEESVLVFKHFPVEFTDNDKKEFLKHFGALDVKCISSQNKKFNITFARFTSRSVAKLIIEKLHQTELLGQLLSVEYVRGSDLNRELPSFNIRTGEDISESQNESKKYDQFIAKLNSWTDLADFRHPPPYHIKYKYPPPTNKILSHLCQALMAVPSFYNQVLHLMNKMNLPCPFVDEYPLNSNISVINSEIKLENKVILSDEESELEDSDETLNEELIPQKRRLKSKILLKRPKFTKAVPVVQNKVKQTVNPSEVFDVSSTSLETQSKKIELKLISDISSLKETEMRQEVLQVETFEPLDIPVNKQVEESIEESEEIYSGKTISDKELTSNRISSRDQRLLPVFKNYHPGIPSCRLYIKNLAKTIGADDLHYIYRRYYTESKEIQGTMYDVRVMQEGRMKGQAFVTLASIGQAELAVQETNGYILQGKPMVVQFARSSKQKT